jgi:4-amino-4-deoxy-L-arabinose transferase-like glycosyltransferase
MSSGRGERIALSRAWIAVGVLTLVALALRIVLMSDSLQDDELFMYQIVHGQSLSDMFNAVRDTEKTPPLFFLLNWVTIKIGDPTVWMRLPSLLCGLASVPLAFVLGLRVAGRRAGLVAAAFVTISPFAIYYATNARAYAGLAFLAALSTYCLLRAVDGNRRGWWAAYGIAVVAVLYTHYAGIFVLAAQAVWALATHRDQWREWLVVHVLVAIAYIPWISSFIVQRRHSGDEAERIAHLVPPSLHRFLDDNVRVFFGHPTFSPRTIPGTLAIVVVLVLVCGAAAYALVRAARSRGRDVRLGSPLALVILLAVITPLGVALASVRPDRSFLLPRNMAASLLFGEIVVAWLLTSLGRRAGVIAAVIALAAVGVGTARSLEKQNRKIPYRDAAHFIEERAQPGDPILQHSIIDLQGAQADVLRLNLEQPHPIVMQGGDEAPAWAAARRGARVFVVQALPGYFKQAEHLAPRMGPGKAFVRVDEQRYLGVEDILVGEYRNRGSR